MLSRVNRFHLMFIVKNHSMTFKCPRPSLSQLLLFLLFFYAMAATKSSCSSCLPAGPTKPTAPLISFLQRLQSAALQTFGPKNFDPKLYVDLPLKHDLSTTQSAFDCLPRSGHNNTIPPSDLKSFLNAYFDGAGSDLAIAVPSDFLQEPEGFLPKVEHPKVRKWALEVHSLWKNLSRKVDDMVSEKPDLHTLLSLPDRVVIPGSRFREIYYWDSYWTIRGLLASKMYDTAKDVAHNLISLIEKYGFVLNGARSYYSNRSQPPLLSSMVLEIYKRTGDMSFVKKSLPLLLKEHKFWNSGIHSVSIRDVKGCRHSLSRYYAMWDKPRPETATIDEESASVLPECERENFYRELASTAESGWDFSSRWMRNSSDLTTLATTSVLPVDLNALILKMELDITFFAKLTEDYSTSKKFLVAAKERQVAMKSIFWNPEMEQWLDYWLMDNTGLEEEHQWKIENQNKNVFASNFIPIWVNTRSSDGSLIDKILKRLKSTGLICEAGIATSLTNTGQQWDFPNGWAPLQHMIVEGLAKSGSEEARSVAEDIAVRWIKTNYAAYQKTGYMHEKYDVTQCGSIGGGGEYKPQTGFGWSNGIVLAFLEEFGWPRDRELGC